MNLALKFKDLGFPTNQADWPSTFNQFKDAFALYLGAFVPDDSFIRGKVGGDTPPPDGMWLDGDIWKIENFDSPEGGYIPIDVAVGNHDWAIVLLADPSENRFIHVPDKDGTVATIEDIYEPRTTVNLNGTNPNIDWSSSFVFHHKMPGESAVAFTMSHMLPGQEIYVLVVNTDLSTVSWPADIIWESGPPRQTLASFKDEVFTDGATVIGVAGPFYSKTAKFTNADIGKLLTSPFVTPDAKIVSHTGVSCTLDKVMIATGKQQPFSILQRSMSPRADLYRFKDVGGTVYGHQTPDYAGTVPNSEFSSSAPIKPTIDTDAGTYQTANGAPKAIVITARAPASKIIYTINGLSPGIGVAGAITVLGTKATYNQPQDGLDRTVKAIAVTVADGVDIVSGVTSKGPFKVVPRPTPTPTLSPLAGDYITAGNGTPLKITVKSVAPAVKIMYTTTGANLTPAGGPGVVTVNALTAVYPLPQDGVQKTIQAIAVDAFGYASPQKSGAYKNTKEIAGVTPPPTPIPVSDPTLSKPSGSYTKFIPSMGVSINLIGDATKAYYNKNSASTPSPSSGTLILDGGVIQIPEGGGTVLKVRAYDDNNENPSSVVSATYDVNYAYPDSPVPTPAAGTYRGYPGSMPVSIKVVAPAIGFIYTIDNPAPLTLLSGKRISALRGSVNIPQGTHTLRMKALDSNGQLSGLAVSTYINTYTPPVPATVPNPTLSPGSGTTPLDVVARCTSPAVKMRYNAGSSSGLIPDPTPTTGTLINATSGAIALPDGDQVVKVIAISSSGVASGLVTGFYTKAPAGGGGGGGPVPPPDDQPH